MMDDIVRQEAIGEKGINAIKVDERSLMVDGIEGAEEVIVCHYHYLGVADTMVVLWKI